MHDPMTYFIWRPMEKDIQITIPEVGQNTMAKLRADYPADTDEAGLHAHHSTIPPRYSEGDLEVVKADYEITGSWGNNAGLTRALLMRSLFLSCEWE